MSYNLVNPTTGDLTRVAGGTLYADNPIGSIIPFGSSTIPSGYLLCNGQAVSRTTYSELFAAIGTAFGTGDGSTTFNIPDMREVVPVGIGQNGTQAIEAHDVYTLGQFKDDQLQDHTHDLPTTLARISTYEAGAKSSYASTNTASYSSDFYRKTSTVTNTYRTGTTTHGKQLGVNYIIKAKMCAMPSDFMSKVDEAVEDAFNYKSGTVNFNCGANQWTTVEVTFDSPMPDSEYTVTLESGNTAYAHVQNVTAKSTNGFIIIVWNRDELTGDRQGIINWQAYKIPH